MTQAKRTKSSISHPKPDPDLQSFGYAPPDSTLGPLVEGLSHDLRSALHAMNGWLQLLQVEGIDDVVRAQALAGLKRSIAAQTGFAERLRSCGAQFEAGAQAASRPPASRRLTGITPLLEQCVAQARPTAHRRNVELRVAMPEPGATTPLAQPALEFILNAMLEAAIAGTSPGGAAALSASVARYDTHRNQSIQLTVRSLPARSSTATIARHDLSTLLAQQLASSIGARLTLGTAASPCCRLSIPTVSISAPTLVPALAPAIVPLRQRARAR